MAQEGGRNIVICCDGTGNQFKPNQFSNVLKLYSSLERSERQLKYYDPGVGTAGTYNGFSKISRLVKWVFGMAFGHGTTADISQAYTFLINNYREGDRIYIFGFSRGAFTARAIAGLLYKCGLLHPDNENLIKETVRIYMKYEYEGREYRETFARAPVPVHFVGVWDTVTSLGWVWNPVRMAHSTVNPAIKHLRHAIAIDERRAFFRSNRFYASRDKDVKQDVKQVWFPGVHSDIGGGYPLEESSLSNIALEWMFVEAHQNGLHIDRERAIEHVVEPKPTVRVDAHKSLTWKWWLGEIFPKLKSRKIGGKWRKYPAINLAKRRGIKCKETLHQSVLDRIAARSDYPPPNIVKVKCKCPEKTGQKTYCDYTGNPVEPWVPIEEGIPATKKSGNKSEKKKPAKKKAAKKKTGE